MSADGTAADRRAAVEAAAEELTGPQPEAAPSLGGRLASPRTVLSLAVALGLLGYFLHRQGPETLAASWAQIRGADPLVYLAALGAYYLAFPIRAARWRILLSNSGEPPERVPRLADLAEIIYLSWFANSVVPAKLGDVYRGWLLRRTGGVRWSHAMGTIVAERVLDVIVLVSLMVVTGFLTYGDVLRDAVEGGPIACLESGLHPGALSCTLLQLFAVGGAVVLVLLGGLVVFARFGAHLERFLPTRLGVVYVRFADALVLSFGRFGWLLALSALAWAAEAACFWLVGRALGHPLPLALVVFFSLLQAFITVIPLTPGGLGFEPVLAGALRLRGFDPAAALAMVVLYRTISYFSLVIGGAVLYAQSPRTK